MFRGEGAAPTVRMGHWPLVIGHMLKPFMVSCRMAACPELVEGSNHQRTREKPARWRFDKPFDKLRGSHSASGIECQQLIKH
jgi:hypothetical protein